jgi:hypothetical protein
MPFDFKPSSFGCDDARAVRLQPVGTILHDWHPIAPPSRRPASAALAAVLGILQALRILSLRPPPRR